MSRAVCGQIGRMDHVIYIAVPDGDDADRIAHATVELAPTEFDFQVLERDEPRAPTRVELAFRIGGAATPEEAIARAQSIYVRARAEADLPPDDSPRASVGIWPGGR